jgi:hypothetical protein
MGPLFRAPRPHASDWAKIKEENITWRNDVRVLDPRPGRAPGLHPDAIMTIRRYHARDVCCCRISRSTKAEAFTLLAEGLKPGATVIMPDRRLAREAWQLAPRLKSIPLNDDGRAFQEWAQRYERDTARERLSDGARYRRCHLHAHQGRKSN